MPILLNQSSWTEQDCELLKKTDNSFYQLMNSDVSDG